MLGVAYLMNKTSGGYATNNIGSSIHCQLGGPVPRGNGQVSIICSLSTCIRGTGIHRRDMSKQIFRLERPVVEN